VAGRGGDLGVEEGVFLRKGSEGRRVTRWVVGGGCLR
jgi:hypothetical protein